MAKTVAGLFDDPNEAEQAINDLLQSGFDRKDVGIVAPQVKTEAEAVFEGTRKGMTVGALAGLLLAGSAIVLPVIGPVAITGPIGLLLAGPAIGALAGGLYGALRASGMSEKEAHACAEGVRRGGILVTVDAETDALASRAAEIMKRHGAVDMDERTEQWKQAGWNGRFESGSPAPQGVGHT